MHFFSENGRLYQFFRLYLALLDLFLISLRSNDFNKEFVSLTSVLTIFSFPFNKVFASLTALSLLRKR